MMLAAAPTSTRQIRAALADWLTAAHWPPDDADDIVLAANEAVANSRSRLPATAARQRADTRVDHHQTRSHD
jgi:hypothetical protein